MLMRFGAEEILGHRVLPDGSGVGITFLSGEDHIELLLPSRNVQGAFTILADILTALGNVNAPLEGQRVNARFPTTFNVALSNDTKPTTCVLLFDANRPTQAAFAIAPFAARKMGKELIAQAREAERRDAVLTPAPQQEAIR